MFIANNVALFVVCQLTAIIGTNIQQYVEVASIVSDHHILGDFIMVDWFSLQPRSEK